MPIIPFLGIDLAASLRGFAGVLGVILRWPRTEFNLLIIIIVIIISQDWVQVVIIISQVEVG